MRQLKKASDRYPDRKEKEKAVAVGTRGDVGPLADLGTGLNNGVVSALISFVQALVLQVLFVLLLQPVFGINGIWFSIVCAEVCALFVTMYCLVRYRKKYRYA